MKLWLLFWVFLLLLFYLLCFPFLYIWPVAAKYLLEILSCSICSLYEMRITAESCFAPGTHDDDNDQIKAMFACCIFEQRSHKQIVQFSV